jgi:hypothetical protein
MAFKIPRNYTAAANRFLKEKQEEKERAREIYKKPAPHNPGFDIPENFKAAANRFVLEQQQQTKADKYRQAAIQLIEQRRQQKVNLFENWQLVYIHLCVVCQGNNAQLSKTWQENDYMLFSFVLCNNCMKRNKLLNCVLA